MAEELRKTEKKIYQTSPDSLSDSDYIATIGDICTLKIFDEIEFKLQENSLRTLSKRLISYL